MYLTRLASLHRVGPDTSVLLNALSGAVDLIDNDLRTEILEFGLGRLPEITRHQELLAERGYLFPDKEEERAALDQVHQAYQKMSASRLLQFVVCPTLSCNLACAYCFESAASRARPEVMTAQQTKDLFLALQQLTAERPGRLCQIALFGGEPLLPTTEGVVADILAQAAEAGIAVKLTTNGTHLERFAPLFRLHPGVVNGAQITLDGTQPVHDARRKRVGGGSTFAEVIRGVETCFELGLGVNLRVNLDAHNIGSLEDLIKFLEERQWIGRKGFQCQLTPVTDHTKSSPYPFIMREDEFVEPVLDLWHRRPELREVIDFRLFRVLHHLVTVVELGQAGTFPRFHYCEADRGDTFAFGPDGHIYACAESVGAPKYAIGVYSPRFELWPRRWEPWQNRNVLTLPECQECNIATFCGGGCAYAALQQFGSPAHGVCEGGPRVVKAYMRLLRKQMSQREPLVPV